MSDNRAEPAPNEAGTAVRLLSGVLSLAMFVVLALLLSGYLRGEQFAWGDLLFVIGLLVIGGVSGILAIRGFVPPGLLWLLPAFRGATEGKSLREK